MRLSELRARETELKVKYLDEEVPFRYYPARFTPSVAEKIQGAEKPLTTSVQILSELLVDGVFTDEEDVVLPPDIEVVGQFPAALVDEMLGAIFDDMKPGEANGVTSQGGSRTRAR